MKLPYLKKFKELKGIKIYFVNGKFIREKISEEFTNFGQHYRFNFIPKNEFWIDKENSPGEEQFFIDHLLIEHQLMQKKVPYEKAMTIAGKQEKKERAHSKYLRKKIKIKTKEKELEKIKIKFLKKYSSKLKVFLVDGELVRDLYYIDFTQGGHDLVYNFIPKQEIWIDNDISPREMEFVLLHEMHERNLMKLGWCYHTNSFHINSGRIKKSAHRSASIIEKTCRKDTKKLKKYLEKEIENQ
jgi:hypothetical protein